MKKSQRPRLSRAPSKSQMGKQAALDYDRSRGDHPYPQALFQQMAETGSQSPYHTGQQGSAQGGEQSFFSESANVYGVDPSSWYAYARSHAYGALNRRGVMNSVGRKSGMAFPAEPMKFGLDADARRARAGAIARRRAEKAGEDPASKLRAVGVSWTAVGGDGGWLPPQRTHSSAVVWTASSGEQQLVLFGGMTACGASAQAKGPGAEAVEKAGAVGGAGSNRTNALGVFSLAYDAPRALPAEDERARRRRLRKEKRSLALRGAKQGEEPPQAPPAPAYDPAALGKWRQVPLQVATGPNGAIPRARTGHTATLVGNEMWVFGGEGKHEAINRRDVFCDLHALDLEEQRWRSIPMQGEVPRARRRHTATLLRTPVEYHQGHHHHRHSKRADAWRDLEVKGGLPSALLLYGGQGPDRVFNMDTFIGDLALFDMETQRWRAVHTDGDQPAPRSCHTATIVDETGLLFVFGGLSLPLISTMRQPRLAKTKFTRDDLVRAAESTRVTKRGQSRTVQHLARTAAGDALEAHGVFASNELYALNTRASPMRWENVSQRCSGEPPSPRAGHSAVRFTRRSPSSIFFYGGRVSNAGASGEGADHAVWVLESVALQWSRVAARASPSAQPGWRYDHVAIPVEVDDPEALEAQQYHGAMVVFGGTAGSAIYNTDLQLMRLPKLPSLAKREAGTTVPFDPPAKSWPAGGLPEGSDSDDGDVPRPPKAVGSPQWRTKHYYAEPWREERAHKQELSRTRAFKIAASTASGRQRLVSRPQSAPAQRSTASRARPHDMSTDDLSGSSLLSETAAPFAGGSAVASLQARPKPQRAAAASARSDRASRQRPQTAGGFRHRARQQPSSVSFAQTNRQRYAKPLRKANQKWESWQARADVPAAGGGWRAPPNLKTTSARRTASAASGEISMV